MWRNHYIHSVPIIAMLTSRTASQFIQLCKQDLEGKLPFQLKVAELKGGSSDTAKHLVHSSFKGWDDMNDYFLDNMMSKLRTVIQERGAAISSHQLHNTIFSVSWQ